jgi:Ribbon-helix-helix protein, copG family
MPADFERERNSWRNMLQRCTYPKSRDFKHYGGRGITVCPEWKESFDSFLAYMGPRPEGHSIDRIDVNGNYEPANCRWFPQAKQNGNKRPMAPELSNRVVVLLSDEMLRALDEWRWQNRVSSRGEAIRLMVAEKLEQKPPKPKGEATRRANRLAKIATNGDEPGLKLRRPDK